MSEGKLVSREDITHEKCARFLSEGLGFLNFALGEFNQGL